MSILMKQMFIIPMRNDLDGLNVPIKGIGSGFARKAWGTTFTAGSTASIEQGKTEGKVTNLPKGLGALGSATNTSPLSALSSGATTVDEYGLAAMLRERVRAGGLTGGTSALTPTQAVDCASAIMGLADWNLTTINTAIAGVVADTALSTGGSFASLNTLIRILSGSVYKVASGTAITSGGNFIASGSRTVRGSLLQVTQSGFQDVQTHVFNGEALASLVEGDLKVMKTGMTFKNPAFAYTSSEVTAWRPRAVALDGTPIPESGLAPVLRVVDIQGNVY